MSDLKERLDRELEHLPIGPIDPSELTHRQHPRHRVLVAAAALVVGFAGFFIMVRAFGGSEDTPTVDTTIPRIEVTLNEEGGKPVGTLMFDGEISTFVGRGFCPKNTFSCPLVTRDPRPSPYLTVPRHSELTFDGNLKAVRGQITLQSHVVAENEDFGSMDVEIVGGVAEIELPANVRPNAYALDILATGEQGYTHFYFGLQLDPTSPRTRVPATGEEELQNGRIAFSTGLGVGIFVVQPDGTGLSEFVPRHAKGEEGGVQMAWSPDGTQLAFTDYRTDGSRGLFVIGAEGQEPEDVSPSLELADSPSWSPDGTQLAFGGCCDAGYETYVVGANGTGLRRVTDELDNGVDGAFMPAWSPDGTKIACVVTRYDAGSQTESHGILILRTDGSQPQFVTRSSQIDEEPVWSPDGTKIAFLRKTPDGYVDVFVTSAIGGLVEPTRLSSSRVHATSLPSWDPDSQEVVFSAQRIDDDSQGIYVASAVGDGQRVLLEDAYAGSPVWSPDGRWITFARDDAGSGLVALSLMRPDGTELTDLIGGFEDIGGIDWQPLE